MTNDLDDTAQNDIAVERFYVAGRHAAESSPVMVKPEIHADRGHGMSRADRVDRVDRYDGYDLARSRSLSENGDGSPDKSGYEAIGRGNIVVCTAASGGIGLSVLAAMLAWEMAERGRRCALVDADFIGGGLDVLLGMEHDRGTRFEAIEAPLGHMEGPALNEDLPVWQGVRILAYDSWNGTPPEWWEARAAIDALASVNDVVIIDAGSGRSVLPAVGLLDAYRIVAAELTVLGLARARSHLAGIMRERSELGSPDGSLGLVGMHPRGATKTRRLLDVNEASEYLDHPVAGPIRHHAKLQYEILEGLGIVGIPRAQRHVVGLLADGVERKLTRSVSQEERRHA